MSVRKGDTSQTEFDFSQFDTEVTEEEENEVIEIIQECIKNLQQQIDDDILDGIFTSEPGSYTMRNDFTQDQLDPEPLTKNRVIEPLLKTLGYTDYGYEAGSFAEERGEQADYSVSLRDIAPVDSTRLLIEAEPINKHLKNRGHGLDQVKSWLSQREFESDFGFATDGVRWIFVRYDPDSYSHNIIEEVDLRPVFLKLFENATTIQDDPTTVLSEEERELINTLLRTFNHENFLSIIDDAKEVIKKQQQEITDEFYQDYIRIVFGVEEGQKADERRARSLIREGISSPPDAGGDDTRLFAVELMNRLVFIKFLEDKKIVRPDLLDVIVETYDSGVYPQTLYKTFFDPLFHDVFNEKPENRDPQIESIDVFSEIPYLNGGLFRPELSGGSSEVDERDFDVKDSVLESIIDLLESYRFSADGGPIDIDPSILGNVFEKTINYLTVDTGDQNKELGAYYTPKEITRFCAEETVRPGLLEHFSEVLVERGWPEAEVEQYDSLYELIDGLPGSGDLITSLLSELDEFYVADPSMGSGHFLTSVVEEIVNVRQALYSQQDNHPSRHRLKKTTIQNNIYGVDIMEPAVEIGKLRLWLSIISELREEDLDDLNDDELALPNITFNIRQGNSLIGYAGFPEETNDGLATFERWSEDSVRSRYEDVIEQITLYEEKNAFPEQAEEHREKAEELLEQYRDDLDNEILEEFRDFTDAVNKHDLENYTPFHWVLEFAEVYAEGGFDVVVGNPPWDEVKSDRKEFFVRYDPAFRSGDTHEMDQRQQELLEDESTAKEWEKHQERIEQLGKYFKNSTEYQYQQPKIDGRKQPIANNLSALFLERIYNLVNEDGYVAQVLPEIIFSNAMGKDLRIHLLNNTSVGYLIGFENKGIFDGIDDRYNFRIATFKNSGETDYLSGISRRRTLEVLDEVKSHTFEIPKEVLMDYSPEVRTFPVIRTEAELGVISSVVDHPPVGKYLDDAWNSDPYYELKKGPDNDRITSSEKVGDYPVYQGRNIYQFVHDDSIFGDIEDVSFWSVEESTDEVNSAKQRIRGKNLSNLKSAIYDEFVDSSSSKSQKQFVNDLLNKHRGEPLSEDDVLLDSTDYRIVYRFITNATNERTFIASVVPSDIVSLHSIYTIRPFEINPEKDDLSEKPLHSAYNRAFTDEELLAATGLLNSIPFDFIMRTKVNKEIYQYTFKETQVPRLTDGDDWFNYIWTRAARLNCYGEEFEELRGRLDGVEPVRDMDERTELQAEIDSAAFHIYGLNQKETEFVLDDFHRVGDPRMMTEDYFDLVFKKYIQLA